MVIFDQLISAAATVVKDFIKYIYSSLKTVFNSFRRWLWALSGRFREHDAFVELCYGTFDEIEDFEIDQAEKYENAAAEEAEARLVFERMCRQNMAGIESKCELYEAVKKPLKKVVEWFHSDVNENPLTEPLLDDMYVPAESPRATHEETLRSVAEFNTAQTRYGKAFVQLQDTIEDIKDTYHLHKGTKYFGRFFNRFESRMKLAKKAGERRDELKVRAHSLEERLEKVITLDEFYSMCDTKEVSTGEPSKKEKNKDEDDKAMDNERLSSRKVRLSICNDRLAELEVERNVLLTNTFDAARQSAMLEMEKELTEMELLFEDEAEQVTHAAEMEADLIAYYAKVDMDLINMKILNVERAIDKESCEIDEECAKDTKKEILRSIKPECRHAAKTWIRWFCKMKNPRAGADEITAATIQRHVELFCQRMKMDLESQVLLTNAAQLMVPLPTKTDIDTALVINCPAARELREQLTVANASVF